MWLHGFWLARDARWIAGMACIYVLAVVAAALTLNPYFSQTWDVVTFAHAARGFLNGADWAGLYAQSRIERYWPYAYPPLHALVIAPLLAMGAGVPDWLWVRVPPLIADLATGLVIYAIVARRAGGQVYARLALAVWLLNPVTFYDTAVQGHFEAEWLFFVLLAYLLAESQDGIILPTLALACGFLFKQTAIILVIPYWFMLAASKGQQGRSPDRLAIFRRLVPAAASVALFAAVVLLISLAFLLYSGDYLYMNMQYVADVPLQTQSWLVALSGIFGPDFWLIRLSSFAVLLACAVISFFSARRRSSLYLTAILITLAFFLLSKKVVGYYYVMLLPFALITFLPTRRFGLLTLVVASTAWISLSPYFASWADPNHLPLYAVLGAANSLLWLGLFIHLWRGLASPSPLQEAQGVVKAYAPVFLSLALFLEAVAAALLQPLADNPASPIRAPIVPPGLESGVLYAAGAFAVILLAAFILAIALTRGPAQEKGGSETEYAQRARPYIARGVLAIALVMAPLYFLTFTLTKESTAFVEIALRSLGL